MIAKTAMINSMNHGHISIGDLCSKYTLNAKNNGLDSIDYLPCIKDGKLIRTPLTKIYQLSDGIIYSIKFKEKTGIPQTYICKGTELLLENGLYGSIKDYTLHVGTVINVWNDCDIHSVSIMSIDEIQLPSAQIYLRVAKENYLISNGLIVRGD